MTPKVAIIYLSFHSEPYWANVIDALKKSTYPKDQIEFIIVDNPHLAHGSSKKYIEEKILPLSGTELPRITFLPQEKNLGFAGGNNVGIKKALELGCEYVYLHNQDGFMAADCLTNLVEALENDRSIGVAQSLVMLYPETNLVNTAGNVYHYLGFGYSGGLRKELANANPTSPRAPLLKERVQSSTANVPLSLRRGTEGEVSLGGVQEIAYASGASLLLRADLLKKHGSLDEDFFAYHEDLEYSLRLKSLGYKIVVASQAVFFHQYSYSHKQDKHYLMERNRYATIFMYYHPLTILLLLPMALVLEAGLVLFSLRQGWLTEKLRAYGYWLNPAHWPQWLKKRRQIQATRKISDHELLRSAVSIIIFDDQAVANPILRCVGNPLMAGYWWLAKKVIVW